MLFVTEVEYPATKRVILCLIAKDQKNFYALKDLYLRYVSILGLDVVHSCLSSLALESQLHHLLTHFYFWIKDDPIIRRFEMKFNAILKTPKNQVVTNWLFRCINVPCLINIQSQKILAAKHS